ncbi:copper amine oxidase N-terminal domain-containing protein [Paenibacillus sp. EZ-K15]|uniref:copper amine oxidase N-terminal domain-containing protein n=1 Tax=Paenibacillus sp. EZ-K15 TaxID=2044275 RepID=UPI000BF69560|nr:copper amine oxidase N-terminal domain-containing protein [Paenibacillus sp. EZ-K15]
MKSVQIIKLAGTASIAMSLLLTSSSLTTIPAHAAAASTSQSKVTWSTLDVKHKPYTNKGVVFVPLKEVSEQLQLQLTTPGKNELYINSPTQSVRITIGQSRAVNAKGTALKLEAAPVVKKGVTYVPASLITRAFGIPLKYDSKSGLRTTFDAWSKYAYAFKANMLFWVNRENGMLSMGKAGSMPAQVGKIPVEEIDQVSLSAHRINSNTYVVDLSNYYGEPHIHEGRYRVLIQDNKILKLSKTNHSNFAGINYKPDQLSFKGNIAMMNGSTLALVHPTGKTVKSYDLAALTGVKDSFIVEAIEQDFLLVRPYTKATLYIVHPTGKTAELIYPELLDEETIKVIEEMPPNEVGFIGDGLTYIGYAGGKLTFQYNNPFLGQKEKRTYTLPF